ncbi:MAG: cytochrome c-550 PedF [Gammaproteobacteria bacterium]|nr:cytochrome c-550 PedF [Gammaproteobacteria bacterium]MBU1725638.1 cytochrome c-550 PedF [Gammaproteobacteria bacterium]MBU2004010.1 cytochrome c-550 PedF [Gammaproteobacteria bacterium]
MVKRSFSGAMAVLALSAATQVWAHGDVTPQAVDITGLEPIEDSANTWLDTNPYSGNEKAIEIGHHAYAQNCARCHGIDAVSGGIAPDLRETLPLGAEGDEFFKERMINGAIRNGITYMPKFEGLIAQEGLWAIRAWLESVSVDAPAKDASKADEKADEKTDEKAAETRPDEAKPDEKTAESK